MLIKYHIAVEMVGAKKHSNVDSQINKKLAKIYDISIDEAKKFKVTELIRLRGNIIHEGHILSTPIKESETLRALYIDLLLHELNLPPKYSLKALFVQKLWQQLHSSRTV